MIGRVLGSYRLVEKIGEGGMGAVYRAVDEMLDRPVAIKAIRPDLAREPQIAERFRSEARLLARVQHPAIATIYSFFHEGDELFLAMEYVPGRTLAQVLAADGPMVPERAVRLLGTALEGIEQAHQAGIIHRDLKPDNLMLTDGERLKVMDFGIARMAGTSHLTRTGLLVGTLRYMAPEQIRGEEVDRTTDVYSLGIVLYQMLTGRVPFDGTTDYAILRAQLEDPPAPLRAWAPAVTAELERAVLWSLAKDPAERFPTVAAFHRALRPQSGAAATTAVRPAPAALEATQPVPRSEAGRPLSGVGPSTPLGDRPPGGAERAASLPTMETPRTRVAEGQATSAPPQASAAIAGSPGAAYSAATAPGSSAAGYSAAGQGAVAPATAGRISAAPAGPSPGTTSYRPVDRSSWKLVAAIALPVLLLAGGGLYLWQRGHSSPAPAPTENAAAPQGTTGAPAPTGSAPAAANPAPATNSTLGAQPQPVAAAPSAPATPLTQKTTAPIRPPLATPAQRATEPQPNAASSLTPTSNPAPSSPSPANNPAQAPAAPQPPSTQPPAPAEEEEPTLAPPAGGLLPGQELAQLGNEMADAADKLSEAYGKFLDQKKDREEELTATDDQLKDEIDTLIDNVATLNKRLNPGFFNRTRARMRHLPEMARIVEQRQQARVLGDEAIRIESLLNAVHATPEVRRAWGEVKVRLRRVHQILRG